MRGGGQKVVPTDMLTARLGNGDVHQVTGPGQGTDAKQPGQVMVEPRFGILEPGKAGSKFGLEVQPTGEQKHGGEQ